MAPEEEDEDAGAVTSVVTTEDVELDEDEDEVSSVTLDSFVVVVVVVVVCATGLAGSFAVDALIFCRTISVADPSESFFMKFQASILLILVQSLLFTDMISSPTLSTFVLSAAPPAELKKQKRWIT